MARMKDKMCISLRSKGRRFAVKMGKVPPQFLIGFVLVTLIFILSVLAPLIVPYPYDEFHLSDRLQPPSWRYLCGTDEFGRDVLSRVLIGTLSSVFVGVGAVTISFILGVPLGLIAGFHGGRLDEFIMRVMDVVMSFPPILLGLLILAITSPSLYKTVLAVGIVYVPSLVRITRSVTLSLTREEFVLSSKAGGESNRYIIFGEILPNAWPPIIVEGSLRITFAILFGACLSFIGLGAQPPSSELGLMISEARAFVHNAPWIALFPGLTLCLLVLGVNLLGDGLRELLDPRLRKLSLK